MQTIDLECPSCKTMLELDAGFAGGVCRCSSCGTLMTVPADPRRERAESLTRPDRPDAPASSGASGTWQAPRPSSIAKAPASPPPPSRPAAPATPPGSSKAGPGIPPASPPPSAPPAAPPGKPAAKPPAPTSADTQTFVTASGKLVRVSNRAIPVARKKREVVRFGVYLAFFLVFGAVVAAVVVGLVVLTSSKPPNGGPPQRPRDGARDVIGYDSSINPFLMPRANCLGVVLEGRSITIVDAAPMTSQWRALALDAVALGAGMATPTVEYQLLLATEQKVQAYPDKPKALGPAEAAAVRGFIDGARPSGAGSLLAAVRAAIEARASQVVLVSGRTLDAADLAQIKELIEPVGTLRLEVVMIDNEPPAVLQSLAQARGGRTFSVPRSVLVRWLKEYEAKQPESPATQP